MLSEFINFVFRSKSENALAFLKHLSIGIWKRYFTKQTPVIAMSFLINKCFFTIDSVTFKQGVGIPMGIDPA